MTERTEDVEALTDALADWFWPDMSRSDCAKTSDFILASDWLAEHDADLYDALRDELAYAIRTRDEWEANAGDAEARAEAAEAETARAIEERDASIERANFLRDQLEQTTQKLADVRAETARLRHDIEAAIETTEKDAGLRERVTAFADALDKEADAICPVGVYDKNDKAWRVSHVRRRVAEDLRTLLAETAPLSPTDPEHDESCCLSGIHAEHGIPHPDCPGSTRPLPPGDGRTPEAGDPS